MEWGVDIQYDYLIWDRNHATVNLFYLHIVGYLIRKTSFTSSVVVGIRCGNNCPDEL